MENDNKSLIMKNHESIGNFLMELTKAIAICHNVTPVTEDG